jgi:hypothetical protein
MKPWSQRGWGWLAAAGLLVLLGSCGGNRPPSPGEDRPSSFQLIDEAVARGELDPETALVYKVYSVFADRRLPRKYLGDDRGRDGTWLMAKVTQNFGQLSLEAQATLKPFLLTPPEPGSWLEQQGAGRSLEAQAIEWGTVGTKNGKVKVWYQKRYAADGARAQKIADAIDSTIWPLLTEEVPVGLGMREPRPDCGATCAEGGGDERLDIYLVEVNRSTTRFYCCQGSPAYILLKRDATFADVAHELMHAIQAAYPFASLEEYRWLMEATAAWAEQYVYPKSNLDPDYPATDEEHSLAPKFLLIPETPLERVNDDHEYGAYLLFFYLQYGLSRPEIVRTVWENATKADSLEVVDAAIPGGFRERWPEFALYNWNQEPVTRYRQWDGLGKGANIVTGFQIGLAGEDLLPADVHHLSAYYYTAKITSESIRTFIVENPFAAGGEPTARLWGIVKIGGQWRQPEDWTALSRKKFCRDKPEEHVEELVLVISNSKWQDRNHRLGAGEVKLVAKESGCGCGEVAGITRWTGNASFSYSVLADDGKLRINEAERSAKVSGTLEVYDSGPGGFTFLGSPTGTGTVEKTVHVYDEKGGLELFYQLSGSGSPVPFESAERGSRLLLNLDTVKCRFNVHVEVYIVATLTDGDGKTAQVEATAGIFQSTWHPIPESLVLNGGGSYPAHSSGYIRQQLGLSDWFLQDDFWILRILGEDNLGAASVSWSFAPVR